MVVEPKLDCPTKGTYHHQKRWSVHQLPEWEPREIIHILHWGIYWTLESVFSYAACAKSSERCRQVEIIVCQGRAIQYMQQELCESVM